MKIIKDLKVRHSYFGDSEYDNNNFIKSEEKSILLSEYEMEDICDTIKRRIDFDWIERTGSNGEVDTDGILDDFYFMLDEELLGLFKC